MFTAILPVVLLMVYLSGVLSDQSPDPALIQQWNKWMSTHMRTYSVEEENRKRMVWEENLKKIQRHNQEHAAGRQSFIMDMNQYGDMTHEEFKQVMNGYKLTSNQGKNAGGSLFMPPNSLEAPQTLDYRQMGYVTPVKNQGKCGSCWAFSATGALEGQGFRKTGKLVSLSEQNLVDCSRPEGNLGCSGGLMDLAFLYVKNNHGLDSEDSYPYLGINQPCHYDPKFSATNSTGYMDIPKGNESALMQAVATVGPVSVGINAGNSFQFYKSGIYYEPLCNSQDINHGMLVVGYGFQGEDVVGNRFWIVKNSWGIGWGDKGYIYMAKDKMNNCGIATAASYPLV